MILLLFDHIAGSTIDPSLQELPHTHTHMSSFSTRAGREDTEEAADRSRDTGSGKGQKEKLPPVASDTAA